MKKGWLAACAVTLAASGLLGCSASKAVPEPTADASKQTQTEVILSAAASLAAPLEQIKADLEQSNPDLRLTLNLGASGLLQKQIEQGAPADLFWSAAAKQMDDLEKKGLLLADTRTNAVGNELVLIVPKERAEKWNVRTFADLAGESVKKVAIGAPETVPAGTYGQQVLQKLQVWNAVTDRLVFGKDVKQVLTYVERGDVDAGLVYGSDARSSDKVQILAKADPSHHQPIVYPIAILQASSHQDAAKRVLDYIKSDKAQDVLIAAGFTKGVN